MLRKINIYHMSFSQGDEHGEANLNKTLPEYYCIGFSSLLPVDINGQRQEVISVEGVCQEQILRGEFFELSIAQEVHEGTLELSCKSNSFPPATTRNQPSEFDEGHTNPT
jgi:hypothetical protein